MFCGQPLYQVILDKLQDIDLIEKIVINTDSEIIINDCSGRYSKAVIIERPHHIRGNEITANTIIKHDLSKITGEHFLHSHCTNPLLSKKNIINAIQLYFEKLEHYDSLFSVEKIKKRVYDHKGDPINHSNQNLEQTQNLPEVFIENSNIFLFSRTSFNNASFSRVGRNPQLFQMSSINGIDIDYKEDFLLAELINKNKELFQGLD